MTSSDIALLNVPPFLSTHVDNLLTVNGNLVSASEVLDNMDVKIFPNPTTGQINIFFAENRDRKIQVFNMLGEVVWQKAVNGNHTTLDLSNLPDGTYLIGLQEEDKMVIRKLVLQL